MVSLHHFWFYDIKQFMCKVIVKHLPLFLILFDTVCFQRAYFAEGQLAAVKCGQAFENVLHLNEVCLPCWPQQGNHHSSFCRSDYEMKLG